MNQALLQLQNIVKSFPGVKALKSITLSVYRGEVLALVGENGAGKSTLIKILTGIISMDSGQIYIEGEEAIINSPLQARKLGLSIVFQELSLINSLSITENLFIGFLPKKGAGRIDWKKANSEATKLLNYVGLDISPNVKVEFNMKLD